MHPLSRRAALVGAAESDLGRVPDKTVLQLAAQAVKRAVEDAGIDKAEIDGVLAANIPGWSSVQLAEYLGLAPRFVDTTLTGGSSFELHVQHASAAIAAGICSTAIIVYASTQASDRKRIAGKGMGGQGLTSIETRMPISQFELPYGPLIPMGNYAIAAQRYMHEYGITHRQLAEVAVATRKWAMRNPKAMMRDPLTIDDVMNSPMLCHPLRMLDCCLVTDGGGAVVITSAARARDLPKKPVHVLGTGECATQMSISQMRDLANVEPARVAAAQAFKMAGLTPGDIDVAEIYDSFTSTVLMSLEAIGFCKPGEGGSFVEGQRTAPDGDFPLNTSGGGLAYTHPGMFGVFLLIEAVRQLRGECGERQVKDAKTALCHGTGGPFAACGTVILGVD